jgi:hypothetical protein
LTGQTWADALPWAPISKAVKAYSQRCFMKSSFCR